MPSSSKFIPMVLSCLLMISMAASAKADVIENLVFTGTATCVDSTCGVGTNATLTGTFTVDLSSGLPVNLDAWSFTSTSSILGGLGPFHPPILVRVTIFYILVPLRLLSINL